MYKSYPALYNAAYNVGRYIASNPQKTYQMARSVYNALPTLHRERKGFLKPRTTTTAVRKRAYTAPASAVRYRYARKPYHRRVYRRRTKKTARIARRYTGRVKKNNVYNRRKKNMRLYNKGVLALQQRLQSGGELPNQTFARMFWRGSNTCAFTVASTLGTPSIPTVRSVSSRSFTLNQLSHSPSNECELYATTNGMDHLVTYSNIWRTLYEEYQVRGAKIKIKISPNFYPSTLSTTTAVTNADMHVPLNAQPGYWYIRVHYNRAADAAATSYDSVGKPIITSVSTTIDDKAEEWANLREFLSDPTVTYRKDTTQIRTKLHLHNDTTDIGENGVINSNFLPNNAGASYEIEKSTKPVYLSTVFSARKHFMDRNVDRNQPWATWNSSLAAEDRFNVRFGYIGFDASGQFAYHIPLDRDWRRFVEVEINYFVALRNPRVQPHDKFDPVDSNDFAGKPEGDITDLEDTFSDFDEPEPYEEPPEEMMAMLNL